MCSRRPHAAVRCGRAATSGSRCVVGVVAAGCVRAAPTGWVLLTSTTATAVVVATCLAVRPPPPPLFAVANGSRVPSRRWPCTCKSHAHTRTQATPRAYSASHFTTYTLTTDDKLEIMELCHKFDHTLNAGRQDKLGAFFAPDAQVRVWGVDVAVWGGGGGGGM
jgi:hypothetical protein